MDVIVVGAGSAGSVVARRLVDAGAAVTLLEAGGPDENPAIHDPARAGELWHGPEDWDLYTVPQPHAAGRRLHLPRGKVLGGSHALNAMIWVRGAPADYDGWGLPGWTWSDVAPVFERIEKDLLDVVPNEPLHPIQQSIVDACRQVGLVLNPDYNSGTLDGVSVQQITVRGNRRFNTWHAYGAPVASRMTVHTGALVHRLRFSGTRVTGVVGLGRAARCVNCPRTWWCSRRARWPRPRSCCAAASARRTSWPRSASTSSRTCPGWAATSTITCSRR